MGAIRPTSGTEKPEGVLGSAAVTINRLIGYGG